MKPTNVHCFFEQSGTFKRAFHELGIHALDYVLYLMKRQATMCLRYLIIKPFNYS